MGLDMYLQGEKYFHGKGYSGSMEKRSERYDLGYWRKHPNLHGFIVREFADGVDECQEIDLSTDDLKKILLATQNPESLPQTSGFFFESSDRSEDELAEDKRQLEQAINWLETKEEGVWRSVYYRASW